MATAEIPVTLGSAGSLDLTTLVREAHARGAAESEPPGFDFGDTARAVVVPDGYRLELLDITQHEEYPRRREGEFPFVGVDSIARYVDRYKTDDTLAYIHDVYGQGSKLLVADRTAIKVVFDDHPSSDHELDRQAANRRHHARLTLRPTAAARRWGAVLDETIDQERFLDLVVDGIGEIASPDGATLRDLVSNLHAIRTTEVKAVMRTGGEGSIELADNVQLRTVPGNKVTFPEAVVVTFNPYAGMPYTIKLTIRVKAKVRADHVLFELTAPELDDAIARLLGEIAGEFAERTGLNPLWTP